MTETKIKLLETSLYRGGIFNICFHDLGNEAALEMAVAYGLVLKAPVEHIYDQLSPYYRIISDEIMIQLYY